MASTTLASLYSTMIDRYGLGRRGTNTGTVATSITDDANLGGGADQEIDVGCQVLITGGTQAGDVRNLATRPKFTSGLVSVDPNFGAVLSSSSTYAILYKPLRFTGGGYGVLDAINQALTEYFLWDRRQVPITLVADGDMLATGVTNWADNNATPTKTAATFARAERALTVTDSGSGGGYAASANIAVEELVSYYLEALGWGTDASDAGTLVLWDVTNDETITLTNSAIDRVEPERLINTVTMPSGCEQVQIRLTCTNASDALNWTNVILRKSASRQHILADRPQRVLGIGEVRAQPSQDWERRSWMDMPAASHRLVQGGAGLWEIHTLDSWPSSALFYEEYIQPATLSAVTDTTTVNAEDLAAVAAEILLNSLSTRSAAWALRYGKAARQSAAVKTRRLSIRSVVDEAAQYVYPMSYA